MGREEHGLDGRTDYKMNASPVKHERSTEHIDDTGLLQKALSILIFLKIYLSSS